MDRSFVMLWHTKLIIIKEDIKYVFNQMPDPAKFGTLLLIKSLVVSIVLGFIAGPATTVYATRFGFRVPIEGTPYINFTIGLWSFIAFIASVALAACIILLFSQFKVIFLNAHRFIAEYRIHIELDSMYPVPIVIIIIISENAVVMAGKAINWFAKNLSLKLSIAFFVFAVAVYVFFSSSFISVPFGRHQDLYHIVAACIWLAVFNFSIWYAATEQPISILQAYITGPIVVLMVVSLFAFDTYGSLLRIIRYGGGIETNIQLDGLTYNGKSYIVGNILLRSSSYLLVYVDDRYIFEIPISKTSILVTDHDASWKMPNYDISHQTKYIVIE